MIHRYLIGLILTISATFWGCIDVTSNEPPSALSTLQKASQTPDQLFNEWENRMISRGVFDYVSKSDCADKAKMIDLYEKGFYPRHAASRTFIEFDFNNDAITDYVVNYVLGNCWEGPGTFTDFIILSSQNGQLKINEELTQNIKQRYFDFVQRNYPYDSYVSWEKGFLVTSHFEIIYASDNQFHGNFKLLRDGPTCCPEIEGSFFYDFESDSFEAYNIKRIRY